MVEEREELDGSATIMDNTAQTTDANTQLTKRRLVVPYVKQDHGILCGTIACRVQSGVCSKMSACCYSLHLFPVLRSVLILSRSTSKAAILILMSSTTTTCTTQKVKRVHAHSRSVSHDAPNFVTAYSLPFFLSSAQSAARLKGRL